jgi:hypothetical protein
MKLPLPTPFQLATLASSVRFVDKSAKEALDLSLKLWFAATRTVSLFKGFGGLSGLNESIDDFFRQLSETRYLEEEFDDVKKNHPWSRTIKMGHSADDSEVLKLVNECAVHRLDKFKSFPRFKDAWSKWGEVKEGDEIFEAEVQNFLDYRQEARRRADAKRARQHRKAG